MEKISSYIGFALKAGKTIVGQTSLKNSKEHIKLIIVDFNSGENLIKLTKNLSVKHNCPHIITKIPLAELTHKPDIKIIGITDENLSKAILKYKENINIGEQ